jgi:hypothetical protein
MAKKKQLAGKKTKLAKLPLTQALAQQAEEGAPWGPSEPQAPPEPESRQLPLSWTQAEKGAAGPLAAAYLQVIEDLTSLQADLPAPASEAAAWNPEIPMPATIPPPQRLELALRQARSDLRDLHRFLSPA